MQASKNTKEGVGLSTKILPHNFVELLNASINQLKGKKFKLYPDFQTRTRSANQVIVTIG